MPKEINQLPTDVKVLIISFHNNSGEVHNKMAAIFGGTLKLGTLKLG